MSRMIYKYELPFAHGRTPVTMPEGAKILSVGNQREMFMFWAEVDPEQGSETRYFAIYGTGHPLPNDPGQYIGTAQFANGRLVFHAYEQKP